MDAIKEFVLSILNMLMHPLPTLEKMKIRSLLIWDMTGR